MNAFSGEIDSGAYRGSITGFPGMTGSKGAGIASALAPVSVPVAATSSVFTFGSGADGNGFEREEFSAETLETIAAECCFSAVFPFCGTENTSNIAANHIESPQKLRALRIRSPLATPLNLRIRCAAHTGRFVTFALVLPGGSFVCPHWDLRTAVFL